MPSPFPGMDPYLEDMAFWPDFHASFITYWRDAINDRLPDDYEARIDERVEFVELEAGTIKRVEPDVAVLQGETASHRQSSAAGAATLSPVTIPLIIEEETRETFIRVLHRPERTVVAVLELLSPSNMEEPGRGQYLAKRHAVLRQPVHLVELDLLLAGRRLPLAADYPAGDYYALVSRFERRPDCDVYAWTVRDPLPTLPIPLRAPDPDVWVPLGSVLSTAYDRGRYAKWVNYNQPPKLSTPQQRRDELVQQVRHLAEGSG